MTETKPQIQEVFRKYQTGKIPKNLYLYIITLKSVENQRQRENPEKVQKPTEKNIFLIEEQG